MDTFNLNQSISTYMSSQLCSICQYPNCNYKTECSHYFHIACMANHAYYGYRMCPICYAPISMPYIKSIKCSSCRFPNNLHNFCNDSFCQTCLIKSTPNPCCEQHKNYISTLCLTCPTCEKSLAVSRFSPIPCPTHGHLCKKCYNQSSFQKECIGKCGFKPELSLVSFCLACSSEKIQFFPDKLCPKNCSLCIECYTWYLLNYGESLKCYYCQSGLLE